MKPDRVRVLTEGLLAGLIGYAAVALYYGVVNLLSGKSFFYTAALLGRGLVRGTGPAAELAVTPGAVFAFNGVHVLAFLVIGVIAAWLVVQTERNPGFFVIALFAALAGFFLSLAIFLSAAEAAGEGLPWWSVIGANLLAGAGMGVYLAAAHPRLWVEIRDHLDPETEHPAPR